jgi:4-carboxymuconolactone decarboxylase
MQQRNFEATEDLNKGVALRKEVLGATHVERSLARAKEDPFILPMQQFATEFAWGKIWARPGLELKVRSMLSIALLAALGKRDELRNHILGALNNGATKEEIQEVLLHTAVYAGFPAGLEAFREAKAFFDAYETAGREDHEENNE